jgi:four helix bundle protein
MGKRSVLADKSFAFSLSVIELCRFLKETKVEYALYNQLLRSGTAIGALVREAEFAQSKADFISKLSIALKEANESKYWIDILLGSHCLDNYTGLYINQSLTEIIRILVSSVNTAKGNKANL